MEIERYRAVVADDSEETRRLVSRSLAQFGIRCDEARDGVAAENLVNLHRYDVIIADLRMPRKHGHELLVGLLEQRHPALLVAITGVLEPKMVGDLITRGVTDVVQKPFDFRFFASKIRALLDYRNAHDPAGLRLDASDLSNQIDSLSSALSGQLGDITQRFQSTIDRLKIQKSQLESDYVESIRILTNVVEGMNQSGESHVARVEEFALALAEKAGVPGNDFLDLRMASLLHELGLIGMPDSVRGKAPWTLNPEEREAYRRYPMLSATIMSGVNGAERSAHMVEQHAENYDGSGFPRGLKGGDIDLCARIIRIADGVDTYAMDVDAIRNGEVLNNHLWEERGRSYDPDLADLAMNHVRELAAETNEQTTVDVPKNQLTDGMTLAENVYNLHHQFLVRKGTRLTGAVAKRVQSQLPPHATVKVVRD